MDTARTIFGLLVVIGMPPAILWWFLLHPFVEWWRRRGVRATLIVMILVQIVALAEAALAIREAARFHAAWWENPQLLQSHCIRLCII